MMAMPRGHAVMSPRLVEMVRRFTGGDEHECVVYLTAQWTAPLDAVVLPYLREKSHDKRSKLLVVKRGEYASELAGEDAVSCDEAAFRELCRELKITRLPAVVPLHNPPRPPDASDAVDALAVAVQSTPCVAEWCVREAPSDLSKDEPELVVLRERAVELFEGGNFLSAAEQFTRVLLRCSTCTKSNFNMSVILQMLGEMYFATDHMLRVVNADDGDAVAHTVLRTVLHPAEPEAVIAGYESIVTCHDDHVRAAHSLATLRGQAKTAAPDYVRQVFDHFAETFEDKLVNHLEYRVPWQLVDGLQRCNALEGVDTSAACDFRCVDLGCGTGLCGRLLRPFATHIAGIDLSPLMIEKTREAGFYDELATADIVPYLESKADASLDLVVSADVWIYVGDLEPIFPVVKRKLRQAAWFAFSTELLSSGDSFQLAASGRFKHSHAYIASLARLYGFSIRIQDDITVRKESGEPIPGRIYVLQTQ